LIVCVEASPPPIAVTSDTANNKEVIRRSILNPPVSCPTRLWMI
jgi:hypothetical protein